MPSRLAIFGSHEQMTIAQLERCVAVEDGARAVLCADGHLGYSMPIGGVVAYHNHVSPSGVGYDIGCGNLAAKTTLRASDVDASVRGAGAPGPSKAWQRIASEI